MKRTLMRELGLTVERLRTQGVRETLKVIPEYIVHKYLDIRDGFDREHGTDTVERVALADAGAQGTNIAEGKVYWPVARAQFLASVSRLSISHGEFAFIDLGSGKGRALLMASELPFRQIIGVEFARAACGRRAQRSCLSVPAPAVHRDRAPLPGCRDLRVPRPAAGAVPLLSFRAGGATSRRGQPAPFARGAGSPRPPDLSPPAERRDPARDRPVHDGSRRTRPALALRLQDLRPRAMTLVRVRVARGRQPERPSTRAAVHWNDRSSHEARRHRAQKRNHGGKLVRVSGPTHARPQPPA